MGNEGKYIIQISHGGHCNHRKRAFKEKSNLTNDYIKVMSENFIWI